MAYFLLNHGVNIMGKKYRGASCITHVPFYIVEYSVYRLELQHTLSLVYSLPYFDLRAFDDRFKDERRLSIVDSSQVVFATTIGRS